MSRSQSISSVGADKTNPVVTPTGSQQVKADKGSKGKRRKLGIGKKSPTRADKAFEEMLQNLKPESSE